jgi:MoaA/NifB/PqqE/SkfB family radical SAM enzyme
MAIIRLTDKCNEKCLFCNFQEKVLELSLQDLEDKLNNLRHDSDLVIFSGGEPTLSPLLFSAIVMAKKMNFTMIQLQTNALRLTDNNFVKELKNCGLDQAFIPILSHQPEIADELTALPGSWQKTISGINNLLSEEIGVRINIVINSKNYKKLLSLVKFIADKFPGIQGIDFSFVVSDGLALKNKYIVPKFSQVMPYLLMAYKYCETVGIDYANPGCGVPVCFLPEKYKNISFEYQLLKEKEEDYDSYDEIIKLNQSNKIKLAKCQRCSESKYCLGIWQGYIKIHGEKEFI